MRMKKVVIQLVVLLGTLGLLRGQSVGIGTSTPHPSARLDVVDTQRGVLIPRMTTVERDAITTPARSLLIYNTDCDVYQYYVPGTGWVTITHSGISGGGGGGSITALPPTGVGSSGYTAHWTPVPGATGYTIKTYSGCSGANPTVVNTTSVSGGTTSSAFIGVAIPCNADMCYEVLATVTTGTACGSSTSQIVSNRIPISPPSPCNTPDTWVQISAGPIPPPGRENQVSIAHGGYIYLGFGDVGTSCRNDWWRWDPCTGTWQALASPPTTIGGLPFIFSIGNYIYVGGGGWACGAYNSAVYRYDPGSNTWTAVASLPAGRHGAVGASDGNYGYVACGQLSGGSYTAQILRYDLGANTWTTLTTYPAGARWIPFMTYHAGRLWIGTGESSSGCTNEFYSYNLSTNTWTSHGSYPRTEFDNWAAAYNGKIYVTGGNPTCSSSCTNIFYYYDIATNTWNTMATFPGGNRNNFQLSELNGVLYGMGGHGSGGGCGPYIRDWWAYCPY